MMDPHQHQHYPVPLGQLPTGHLQQSGQMGGGLGGLHHHNSHINVVSHNQLAQHQHQHQQPMHVHQHNASQGLNLGMSHVVSGAMSSMHSGAVTPAAAAAAAAAAAVAQDSALHHGMLPGGSTSPGSQTRCSTTGSISNSSTRFRATNEERLFMMSVRFCRVCCDYG